MVNAMVSMPDAYICSETIDDLMRLAIQRILSTGDSIHPTKGPAKELSGALLEMSNPRSRISLTETRGKPYSCLGELCWYLAQTNDLDFICYYISDYINYSDGRGGYGPRLFNWRGTNQFENVAALLDQHALDPIVHVLLGDAGDLVGGTT